VKKGPLDLSDLARELTAMYQLLPTFKCYDAGDGKLVKVGETSGIPQVNAVMAKEALAFHHEIETAVASNQKLAQYQSAGYRIYPAVGIEQQTNLTARLAGEGVDLLQTYEGEELGGDGTVPRFSAIPLELSDKPTDALYAATQHGSLQNADAVINDLIGHLSGMSLDLTRFRIAKPKSKSQVALEVEDVFFAGEPIVVRARPSLKESMGLDASLWRIGESQPLATATMQAADGDWQSAEFAPPGAGAYRVTVAEAEDSFVVAEISAGDL
jgi:hypothetical protein